MLEPRAFIGNEHAFIAEDCLVIAERCTLIVEQRALVAEARMFIAEQWLLMGDDRAFVDDEALFIVEQRALVAERRAFMADVPLFMGDDPAFISDDTAVIDDEAALIAQERTKVLDERALLGHEHASLDDEGSFIADPSTSFRDDCFIISDRTRPCGGFRSRALDKHLWVADPHWSVADYARSHAIALIECAPVLSIATVQETYTLTFASELNAPMAAVWEVVGTMKGVNAELAPWLRMTAPPEAANLRIEDAPVGSPLFSSWVLLRGILPIDRHHFMLTRVERGSGFAEDSTSWSQRRWQHHRSLEPRGEGRCMLTDRLTFTPRLWRSGPLLKRVIGAIFRHRHRLLRERFH
jgi:hypothetical protein